ncbi:MAG: cell filamentation protein Fic [Candidatus Altiarchaeales archaeon A3]|nr:MAG: cell filamentation protein Fic [Candidatus Altiarchaeales archaeon A3]
MEKNQIILYTTPGGNVKLEVFLQDETLWLTQKMMAELFGVEINTINYHLKEIFKSSELDENSVIQKIRITASDGKEYLTAFYNLDVIIAVSYRVNSRRATQFRIWATHVLKEYIIKGFALNDELLKQGKHVFGKDYFIELLERVRSIRASERRIYIQITDIFAECCLDYDPNSRTTKDFFATVQNKFHYAITGQTAAEIINAKADKKKPFMGLTTWKNSPEGRILPSDVVIAKNYLQEKEIKKLERTIYGFFDYIERHIENRQTFTMVDFAESVNRFLSFNEYKILDGKGAISKEQADKKAMFEYDTFNKIQPIESDFDREIKRLLKDKK